MSETRIAACHCGAVELNIKFDNGLENIRRCDCSLCSRKGYVMASVPVENVTILKGKDVLSLYQWDTKVAEHYFCSKCGVYTHHKRLSNQKEYGINIACIDGVKSLSYKNVPVGNGELNDVLPNINKKV